MKKLIKCALSVAFATTLLINPLSPATAISAATIVGYTYDKDLNYTQIEYSTNDPLYIDQGETKALANPQNNGRWHVEAGQLLHFNAHFMQIVHYQYKIINATTGQTLVTDTVGPTDNCTISTYIEQTGDYVILLTPTSAADLFIDWFFIDID